MQKNNRFELLKASVIFTLVMIATVAFMAIPEEGNGNWVSMFIASKILAVASAFTAHRLHKYWLRAV